MPTRTNIRRAVVSAATIVALVSLVAPLCASGCEMSANDMGMHGQGFSGVCALMGAHNVVSVGVVPPRLGAEFALLGLMLVAALALGSAGNSRALALETARSNAPPGDPLGVRLRI